MAVIRGGRRFKPLRIGVCPTAELIPRVLSLPVLAGMTAGRPVLGRPVLGRLSSTPFFDPFLRPLSSTPFFDPFLRRDL